MFSQTFVDGTQQTRKPYTVVVSILLQTAAICITILVPLLYTQTLPSAQLKSMLMAPAPPPPVAPKTPVAAHTLPAATVRIFQAASLIAPSVIPPRVNAFSQTPATPDFGGTANAADQATAANSLLWGSTGPPSPAPPPIGAPKPNGPLRIGGVVAEANIIHRVQPVYPPLAKSARVQGAVEFTAVISKEGHVEKLQLVRGHPLLVNAARDAILQWQYRPTLLNGQPVEVMTTITVNFTLSA